MEGCDGSRLIKAATMAAKIRGEKANVRHLHVVVVGAPQAGGGSLLSSLLGRSYAPQGPSVAPGMQAEYAVATVEGGRLVECHDVVDALSRLYVASLMKPQPSADAPPQAKSATSAEGTSSTNGKSARSPTKGAVPSICEPVAYRILSDQPTPDEVHHTVRAFLGKDLSRYMKSSSAQSEFTVITFLELHGQCTYPAVQPLLMTSQTTLVVTYDASKDLMERAAGQGGDGDSAEECAQRAALPQGSTRLDQLLSWFDMLLPHGRTSGVEATQDLFTVGCCSAGADQKKYDDAREVLHKKIRQSRHRLLVQNPASHFTVDSTGSDRAGTDGIQRLRSTIIKRCRESNHQIPVVWLRFCIAIQMLKKESDLPWISLRDATTIAEAVDAVQNDDTDGMEQLLRYAHDAGHLAYFPSDTLEQLIILNSQFILDCVSAFANVNFQRKRLGMRKEVYLERYNNGTTIESVAKFALKKYEGHDSLTNIRLDHIMSNREEYDCIFGVLEELGLLASIPIKDDDRPDGEAKRDFMIPAVAKLQRISIVEGSRLSLPIYLCLTAPGEKYPLHFPVALYWKCVASVLHMSPNISWTQLSLDEARIYWCREGWPWLRMRYARFGLQVCLEGYTKLLGDHETGTETLEELRQVVSSVLVRQQRRRDVVVRPAVPCPCGLPAGNRCIEHGRKSCDTDSCAHALGTMADGKAPVCPLQKTPQRIAQVAPFWLAMEQDKNLMLHKCEKKSPGPSELTGLQSQFGKIRGSIGDVSQSSSQGTSGIDTGHSDFYTDTDGRTPYDSADVSVDTDTDVASSYRNSLTDGNTTDGMTDVASTSAFETSTSTSTLGADEQITMSLSSSFCSGSISRPVSQGSPELLYVPGARFISGDLDIATADDTDVEDNSNNDFRRGMRRRCKARTVSLSPARLLLTTALTPTPGAEAASSSPLSDRRSTSSVGSRVSQSLSDGDGATHYQVVSESNTSDIPIHPDGTIIAMRSARVCFPAGAVDQITHIPPPVHFKLRHLLKTEEGAPITFHSMVVLRPHGTHFDEPVKLEIDVPGLDRQHHLYLVHYPCTDNAVHHPSLTRTGSSSDAFAGHSDCTIVHVGRHVWTLSKYPEDKHSAVPAKASNRTAAERLQCPYDHVTVDHVKKLVRVTMRHFSRILVVTSPQLLSEKQKGLLRSRKRHLCRVFVYTKWVDLDAERLGLSIRVIPSATNSCDTAISQLDDPPLDMTLAGRASEYILLRRTDCLEYTFRIIPAGSWVARDDSDRQTSSYMRSSLAHFELDDGCRLWDRGRLVYGELVCKVVKGGGGSSSSSTGGGASSTGHDDLSTSANDDTVVVSFEHPNSTSSGPRTRRVPDQWVDFRRLSHLQRTERFNKLKQYLADEVRTVYELGSYLLDDDTQFPNGPKSTIDNAADSKRSFDLFDALMDLWVRHMDTVSGQTLYYSTIRMGLDGTAEAIKPLLQG
ncbi:uncharacterized protein LOC135823121 [Sycon ciliatum]|uniref:uncharacterized protein LOC135823121 n=1 Tax=Sycon ciliatum TaxID=27933 RepID=UPI0031F66DFF